MSLPVLPSQTQKCDSYTGYPAAISDTISADLQRNHQPGEL